MVSKSCMRLPKTPENIGFFAIQNELNFFEGKMRF